MNGFNSLIYYLYIYIEREREIEREVYIYIHRSVFSPSKRGLASGVLAVLSAYTRTHTGRTESKPPISTHIHAHSLSRTPISQRTQGSK